MSQPNRYFDARWLGAALFGALAFSAMGCPNPQTYGTPRTVPKGEIQHSIAIEGIGIKSKGGGFDLPTAPTYTFRIGVHDSVDIGVRAANLTTLHVDAKFAAIVSKSFDLAIAPGVQAFYFSIGSSSSSGNTNSEAKSTISGAYFHLPVLLGLNLSSGFTIVPTLGILYGVASAQATSSSSNGTTTSSSSSDSARGNTGVIGRFGLGFNIRISTGFALHPEFTLMKPFREGADGVLYMMGLGFNFGKLPNYDDQK